MAAQGDDLAGQADVAQAGCRIGLQQIPVPHRLIEHIPY
jgi:hypothetical protein